jgi:hypothetical protein
MNKFKKLGFVEYNGDLKINPTLVTVVVHEGDPSVSKKTSPYTPAAFRSKQKLPQPQRT